ncbi:MAG: DUF86 domain-containing protein [Desulfoprunum sp.]|nr:DUF86 domain-containing protein [Desulfoprunum sp.]
MKSDILYTIHICECLDRIQSYAAGIDQNQFLASSLIQDAVLRNLQVLAESSQRLSDDFKTQHPEIEWYKISGLRNILTHDYLGIDIETVWVIISEELSKLKRAVKD